MIIFFSYPLLSIGQTAPAFRQFYFNPYLVNPAFAGMSEYTEVSLFYRQQWAGFNDAPSAAGFSIQYPTQNRASFAMNVIAQEAVVLRTTSTQATFAYRVPLAADHFLFFGLSGVVGFNNLNLDNADYSNDPTILNAASSTVYGDANVGLVYEWRSLRVGFAMPRLFGQPYFSPQDMVNVRYAQLRNQLYSASYKFHTGNFSVEPYALYRINRDLQNWWEAATLVYYKEKIWMGASYHSKQGGGFFLGMEFKEKLKVGYSFELPPLTNAFISVNSHEIQLKLKIGNKRIFKWASKSESPIQPEPSPTLTTPLAELTTEEVATQVKVEEEQDEPFPDPIIIIEEVKEEKADTLKAEVPRKPIQEVKTDTVTSFKPAQPILIPGYYIIAGLYRFESNALELQKKLTDLGFQNVRIGWHPIYGNYHVYVFTSPDRDKASEALPGFRSRAPTSNAWLLGIR